MLPFQEKVVFIASENSQDNTLMEGLNNAFQSGL